MADGEPETARGWVVATVRDRTSGSDPWTGAGRLESAGEKDRIPWTTEEIEEAIGSLIADDVLLNWHGQLCMATQERLDAAKAYERETHTEFPRRLLLDKIDRVLVTVS